MNNFGMILGHYLKRFIRDWKEVLLLLVIPIGLIILYSLFDADFFGVPEGFMPGYNIQATFTLPPLMLGFQFFSGSIMLTYLYPDIRGSMNWRLRAAPLSILSFVVPAFVANWLFAMLLGAIVVAVSVLFLNAYIGSFFILAVVLLLTSMIATLLYMIIFLLVKKSGVANALIYILSFGQFILSGFLFIPLGDNAVSRFLMTYGTPLSLGNRAITYSGSLREIFLMGMPMRERQDIFNIGILAAIVLVLAIVMLVVGRKKKI
jgi:ABC-2 type transport system permease protein